MADFHENDLVALLVDQPDDELCRGDVGIIIHVFDITNDHPSVFVVEFVDTLTMLIKSIKDESVRILYEICRRILRVNPNPYCY